MNLSAAAIALLFFLSGCSASGPKFQDTPFATQQVPTDKARILFLRPFGPYPPGRRSVPLDMNGHTVGKISPGEFCVVDIVPGEHEISVSLWDAPGRFAIKVSVQAGQTYYLQMSPREEHAKYGWMGAFGLPGYFLAISLQDNKGPYKLEPIDPPRAIEILSDLKLAE